MKEKDTIYFDYLIVGGGAHGLSSVYQLSKEVRKNGEKVKIALVEQFQIGHEFGSSHGACRICRTSYWDPLYTNLTKKCLKQYWSQAQQVLQTQLVYPNPYFNIDEDEKMHEKYASNAKQSKGQLTLLNRQQACSMFPNFPSIQTPFQMIFDPNASLIASDKYLQHMSLYLKQQLNIKIFENTKVEKFQDETSQVKTITDKIVIVSQKVVVSCGKWITNLYPSLAEILSSHLQIVLYLELENMEQYERQKFPAFSHRNGKDWYFCVPNFEDKGVKLSKHVLSSFPGQNNIQQRINEIYERGKAYFGDKLLKIKSYEKCYYTATKEKDFVIDWIDPGTDRILICSCCSGHSFKMSPIIGKIVRDELLGVEELPQLKGNSHKFKIPFHQGLNLK